jgi:hypothetical protein
VLVAIALCSFCPSFLEEYLKMPAKVRQYTHEREPQAYNNGVLSRLLFFCVSSSCSPARATVSDCCLIKM